MSQTLREYRALHAYHAPRPRLSPAGKFWSTYLTAVAGIALWWLL